MRALPNKLNKNQLTDKEEIINYEYAVLDQSARQVQPTISNSEKYAAWTLQQKIAGIIGQHPHSVRWIGNSETAYLQTYAYILLIGSGHSEANFLEFKHMIYKIGKKCLSVLEQKLLVQFLCLIEYSRDRYSFLNKYPQIETVFLKLLQHLQNQHSRSENIISVNNTPKNKAKVKRRNLIGTSSENKKQLKADEETYRSGTSLSLQFQSEMELEQIYRHFNRYFQFISIIESNQYCCALKLFDSQKIYVIIEKDCYFMVEPSPDLPLEQHLTFGQNKGHRTIVSELEDIMNNEEVEIEHDEENIGIKFNKEQFEQIFNFHNEVAESSVRSIDKGEEIKTPKSKSKKINKFNPCAHPMAIDGFKEQERTDHDHTFIDDLIFGHNESIKSLEHYKRENKLKSVKSTKMQDSLKGITTIKEELKKIGSKIEDKIKKIDKNMSLKNLNPNAVTNISTKPSIPHFFRKGKNVKRSNSDSIKPEFYKNHVNIGEPIQKQVTRQLINTLKHEKDSPIKSNNQLIEQIEQQQDILKNLNSVTRKDSKDYLESNNFSKNFNLNVNVNINNIKGVTKQQLQSQHSHYPLPHKKHLSSISRYPSQYNLLPREQASNELSTKIKYPNFLKKQQIKNPETNISFCKVNTTN